MKFFIINSFRTMVYVAYIAIIVGGIWMGFMNAFDYGAFFAAPNGEQYDSWLHLTLGLPGLLGQLLTFVGFSLLGWIAASLVCGLIVTLLDIRDDINDRLPDARRDI